MKDLTGSHKRHGSDNNNSNSAGKRNDSLEDGMADDPFSVDTEQRSGSSRNSRSTIDSSTRLTSSFYHGQRDDSESSEVTSSGFASVRAPRALPSPPNLHPYGPTPSPSILSGSDFDRYPILRSQMPPRPGAARWYPNLSDNDDSSSSVNSRTVNEKHERLFLRGLDDNFGPFGGYPVNEFLVHIDEKEEDDYLHNPDPIADGMEDRVCHRLDRRGWGCLIAFFLLIAGAIIVFILLPILAFTGPTERSKAPDQDAGAISPYVYGHLAALRPLIDSDTPKSARSHTSRTGEVWDLVFSDEFNVNGRTFYSGDDLYWEGGDFWYGSTQDLEWYDPDAITTANGSLIIQLDAFQTHDLNYRSGMLQSWNKLCFRQGYIEIGALLPGNGNVLGFWPGLWTLGNLARAGYRASSDGVWPYSYFECDAGITPNQSSADGLNYLPGQRLPSCVCSGGDTPTPGKGRGAPEIDIIEGAVVNTPNPDYPIWGTVSQTVQLAPMDIWYMVDYDFIEVYNSTVTKMNTWTGGPFQQAVSGYTYLNKDWYETGGDSQLFQSYGFEYFLDEDNDSRDGYISWYVGQDPVFTVFNAALSPNGNVGQRQISHEPMSIIMNLGLSTSWSYIDWLDLTFPAKMRIDHVRIYQSSNWTSLTCDPEGWETTQYISEHSLAYTNSNLTTWAEAGYSRPKNSLMDGC